MAEKGTPKHSYIACLLDTGWHRSEEPWDEEGQLGPGECNYHYGCSRPGRWTHPSITGEYCGQHAHVGTVSRGWGGHQ